MHGSNHVIFPLPLPSPSFKPLLSHLRMRSREYKAEILQFDQWRNTLKSIKPKNDAEILCSYVRKLG